MSETLSDRLNDAGAKIADQLIAERDALRAAVATLKSERDALRAAMVQSANRLKLQYKLPFPSSQSIADIEAALRAALGATGEGR